MAAVNLPVVIVKVFAAEPRESRTDTIDGYEVVQRLGVVRRKIVHIDLATVAEIEEVIATEFPGGLVGRGTYVFESANYSEPLGKCNERMNCVLSGSLRTPV